MYWRFLYFALVIALGVLESALVLASGDFPIGIGIGADYITSAYINDNEDFGTVACIETTQEWKDCSRFLLQFGHEAKKVYRYSESEVNELLTTALISIREATKTQLNREIEILGLTNPDFIANAGFTRNLLHAAIEVLPGIEEGTVFWPYLHSIRLAFPLNNAEALGYLPGTDIDPELNLLLHFDYQNSSLEVSITEIGTITTNMNSHFRIVDLGGTNQVAPPEKLQYLAKRTKSLVIAELEHNPATLKDFRRIVFSGDAPDSEFQKIREVIVKVFPDFSERFAGGIDPKWVAAVGAARLAREWKLTPEIFERDSELVIDDRPNPHYEL